MNKQENAALAREVFRLVSERCERAGLLPVDAEFRGLLVTMLASYYTMAGGGVALREALFDDLGEFIRAADRMLARGSGGSA
jgi:hypothetical protein